MEYSEIKEKILNQNDFYIINITRLPAFLFDIIRINKFSLPDLTKEIFFLKDVEKIFNSLKDTLEKYKNYLVFVIFTEYFFYEYTIISDEDYYDIINRAIKLTDIYKNSFIFINLMHYVNKKKNN